MRPPFRWLAALCALAAMLALGPQAALAASKVRIEYVRTAPAGNAAGAADGAVRTFVGQETIANIGASQVLSAAAPEFKTADYSYRNGLARVTVISGSVIAAVGTSPTVSESTGVRIEAGQTSWIAIETGQKLALIEAADGPIDSGTLSASGVAPVTGTFTGTGNGLTFPPAAGRPFNLTVYATGGTAPGSTLNATVYVARSTDGGTTYLPMTAAGGGIYSFTALANEALYESQTGVTYRLVCSSYTSGTVNYRWSQ